MNPPLQVQIKGGKIFCPLVRTKKQWLVLKPEEEVRQRFICRLVNDYGYSRGNALSLVGAAIYVNSTRKKLMLPDLVFRAVWKNNSPIRGEFLAEVLRTSSLRKQIEAVATGTSPSMKKVTKPALLNLEIPLPPLPEQSRIVAELDRLRAKARSARATAAALRTAASKDFQAALFHGE